MGQKQDEKRASLARADDYGGFDDDYGSPGNGGDVVIDEEELALLREMKDLKRHYRENYEKLRQVKISIADAQNNVDGMK